MSILVLSSGGLKSACLLACATKEVENKPECVIQLFLNHGQPNYKGEVRANEAMHERFRTRYEEYRLPCYDTSFPVFKLTWMISFALMLGKRYGVENVYYGASQDDKREECTNEYLDYLKAMVNQAQPVFDRTLKRRSVMGVEAPLLQLNDATLTYLCNNWSVPFDLTWDCLKAGDKHCGICPKCKRRKRCFEASGIKDPIRYRSDETREHTSNFVSRSIRKLSRVLSLGSSSPDSRGNEGRDNNTDFNNNAPSDTDVGINLNSDVSSSEEP